MFLDDELMLKGFDCLKLIDESSDKDVLNFYLTEFSDMRAMNLSSVWQEEYNSEAIYGSDKEQWQFALSGMYFLPQNESWCAVYVDNIGRDFILLGANKKLLAKMKNTFNSKYLLNVEDL